MANDTREILALIKESENHIVPINEEAAHKIIDSFESKRKFHDKSDWGLFFVLPSNDNADVFAVIDNTSGDCWTEEFHGVEAALAWLNGASLDEVQEKFASEKPGKTLQDLCDEPIVGDVMIGGVHIVVDPKLTDLTYNEAVNYIELCEKQKGNKTDRITEIVLEPREGDNIYLDWTVKPLPFDRIRRITGYLVGDLNRWNNAKRQEEHDRVKHGIRNVGGIALTAFVALFSQVLKDFFTIFDR